MLIGSNNIDNVHSLLSRCIYLTAYTLFQCLGNNMNPGSCFICKKGNADILTRCGHKYHEQCLIHRSFTDKRSDCLVCGSPVSNVQQLEDLMSEKITLDEIFEEDSTIMFDPEVMHWALQHYDLDLVYIIAKFDHGVDMEYYVSYAAEDGHLNMLKLIYETYDRRPGVEALGAAIQKWPFRSSQIFDGNGYELR